MRFFLGGPRIFGIRPGVSFGPSDFAKLAGPQKIAPASRLADGSFIYVVVGDHGRSKIGISSDPVGNLASLNRGSAFPLRLAYIGAPDCNTLQATRIEREAHNLLARHKTNLEWFDVPPEAAVSAIAAVAYRNGVKLMEVSPQTANLIISLPAPKKRWRITWNNTILFIITIWLLAYIYQNHG